MNKYHRRGSQIISPMPHKLESKLVAQPADNDSSLSRAQSIEIGTTPSCTISQQLLRSEPPFQAQAVDMEHRETFGHRSGLP
jgi:hypothetical protein